MLVLLAALCLCAQQQPSELYHAKQVTTVMGTELIIEAWHAEAKVAETAIAAAEKEIRRVEDLATDWRPSPLETLNDSAGQGPVKVDEELVLLIAHSLELGQLTEGAFDISFGAIGKFWKFKGDDFKLPDAEKIKASLKRVDWKKIIVDVEKSTIELPAGMRIGLGGVAKGYGVDCAMQVLLDHGIQHGIVNAGGDLKALGKDGGRKLYKIAIKHPRDEEKIIALLPISNTCVVTSGDYERFFEIDDVRYHHILDPRTGYPATGAMSATVVARQASVADALATALCVMDVVDGMALIEKLKNVEAVVVDFDGKVMISSGLKSD
jgi:thiamine biosynthesis lipoprotein